MPDDSLRGDEAPAEERGAVRAVIDRLIRHRFIVYLAFAAVIVVWKLWPTISASFRQIEGLGDSAAGQVAISGADMAQDLIIEAVAQFQTTYPGVKLSLGGGDTISALEDLLNDRADVAVMARPPTAREQRIAVEHGDSLLAFPIAIAGISIVAPRASGLTALPIDELRRFARDGTGEVQMGGRSFRVYGPDPNGGLWTEITERLGVETNRQPVYTPLPDGEGVIAALRQDPQGIGFASEMTFVLAADDPDLAEVALIVGADSVHESTRANIVNGTYPLFHYVYLCTMASRGPLAAGFVTYYSDAVGQKWVAKQGFIPARLPVREIRLSGGTQS